MLFTIQQITLSNKEVLSYKHKNQSTQKWSGEDHGIRSKSRSTSQSVQTLIHAREVEYDASLSVQHNKVSEGERDDMALKTQTPT